MAPSKTLVHPLRVEVSGTDAFVVFDAFDAVNGRHLGYATLRREPCMSPDTFKRLVEMLKSADG